MVYPHSAPEWFAIMVKPRFEKSVASLLRQKGYEDFLPLTAESRKWSDRVKTVQLPIFSRYLFCRFSLHDQVAILNTPGVQWIIGFGAGPKSIPDQEIESLRKLVASGFPPLACEYLADGQRVLVREGPLAGMEGLLVKTKSDCRIVVSIHLLQRSVYAEVDRTAVIPVPLPPICGQTSSSLHVDVVTAA
jgi:transcription antitermination factor NusG